jgi:hypothetical protein
VPDLLTGALHALDGSTQATHNRFLAPLSLTYRRGALLLLSAFEPALLASHLPRVRLRAHHLRCQVFFIHASFLPSSMPRADVQVLAALQAEMAGTVAALVECRRVTVLAARRLSVLFLASTAPAADTASVVDAVRMSCLSPPYIRPTMSSRRVCGTTRSTAMATLDPGTALSCPKPICLSCRPHYAAPLPRCTLAPHFVLLINTYSYLHTNGSVREAAMAAMAGLLQATSLGPDRSAARFTTPFSSFPSVSLSLPSVSLFSLSPLFSHARVVTAVRGLVQQMLEKIDRTRAVAGAGFFDVLYAAVADVPARPALLDIFGCGSYPSTFTCYSSP